MADGSVELPAMPASLGRVEHRAAAAVLGLRWIMAPVYIGLAGALLIVLGQFTQKVIVSIPKMFSMNTREALLTVLSLVDLALVGNLVIIVIFAGWTNVIGPLPGTTKTAALLSEADFGTVKLKLIGAIAAVATIQTLEILVQTAGMTATEALWRLAVLLSIGVIGVLLALMDRIAATAKH